MTTSKPARTAAEAHARIDALETQVEALVTALKQLNHTLAELKRADGEHVATLDKLNATLVKLESTMSTFVADSDEGRKMFERILNQLLLDKSWRVVRYGGALALASLATWGPKLWALIHD